MTWKKSMPAIFILLAVCQSAIADEDLAKEQHAEATQLFKEGKETGDPRLLEHSKSMALESFRILGRPLTAYLLAVVNLELRNIPEVERYARLARSIRQPRISPVYEDSIDELLYFCDRWNRWKERKARQTEREHAEVNATLDNGMPSGVEYVDPSEFL
jgi:hypothetical protein